MHFAITAGERTSRRSFVLVLVSKGPLKGPRADRPWSLSFEVMYMEDIGW